MNIREKLMNIQAELKAPKNQFNSFGKYNYRSCEDILEGLKPLLLKYRLTLVINDEVVNVGDRNYVKSTAILTDVEKDEYINSVAFAREDESKKGMDGSQLTGSTSSYARKYALNGLFAIDDTKDSDYTNKHGKEDMKATGTKPQSSDGAMYHCNECDENITQAVYTFSTKKYGRPLCMEHQKTANEAPKMDKNIVDNSLASETQLNRIYELTEEKKYTAKSMSSYIKNAYNKNTSKALTVKEADEVIKMLQDIGK